MGAKIRIALGWARAIEKPLYKGECQSRGGVRGAGDVSPLRASAHQSRDPKSKWPSIFAGIGGHSDAIRGRRRARWLANHRASSGSGARAPLTVARWLAPVAL